MNCTFPSGEHVAGACPARCSGAKAMNNPTTVNTLIRAPLIAERLLWLYTTPHDQAYSFRRPSGACARVGYRRPTDTGLCSNQRTKRARWSEEPVALVDLFRRL